MTTATLSLSSEGQLDPLDLRTTFGCFPSGVTALCSNGPNGPVGMAASAFTSVSLNPALVSVCIQKTSSTWPLLRQGPAIGVSILAAGQESICRSLAATFSERFADVNWTSSDAGAVYVNGSVAWLECVLHDELDAGDHIIALLRITGLRNAAETAPLVFHRSGFRTLSQISDSQ